MTSLTDRLAELGSTLPAPATPGGSYDPVVVRGGFAFVSGQVSKLDGEMVATGTVGAEVDLETARECARACALNVLAALAPVAGGPDLPLLDRIVKLDVFVASAPGFHDQPAVADGASDLLVELLGDAGRHSRVAIGVAGLPRRSPVEIGAVVALRAD
jgi:enamine deaminase RidA (YjgF/YER057c/UK114 family)